MNNKGSNQSVNPGSDIMLVEYITMGPYMLCINRKGYD